MFSRLFFINFLKWCTDLAFLILSSRPFQRLTALYRKDRCPVVVRWKGICSVSWFLVSRLCIEERFENLSHKYSGASEFIHLYVIIESLRRSCSLTGSHSIWCSAGVMWSNFVVFVIDSACKVLNSLEFVNV